MFAKKLFVVLLVAGACVAAQQFAGVFPIETVGAQTSGARANAAANAISAAANVAANASIAARSGDDEAKKSDVSPEVREKAVALLKSAARETANYAAAQNRVRGGIAAADLLWEHDETAARTMFQAVESELQTMFNNAAAAAADEESDNNNYTARYALSQLRSQYLLALAPHDPRAALAAFNALRIEVPSKEDYDPLKVEGLELEIAAAMAKKDPEQSLELAQKSLKNTLDYNTLHTLSDLYKNNSEIGAKFARDVLAKFKTAKVRRNTNTNTATGSANNSELDEPGFYADLSLLAGLLQSAHALNAKAEKAKPKQTPLLTNGEMRELSDLTAQVFVKQGAAEPWAVGGVMQIITKHSPGAANQIRSRLNNEQLASMETIAESSEYYIDRDEKTVDEVLAAAEKAPTAERDTRFADAINKALEKDELEKANEAAGKIRDRKSYEYVFDQIKQSAPAIKARRGDINEVRKMLAAVKNPDEKVTALTELVVAVAGKGDKEAAGKILDEANQFLPARLKRRPNLDTTLRIANAFALVQPERGFALLENSIAQMNDLIEAGVLVQDFYEYETIEADEVLFDSMERQGLSHTTNVTALIRNLATADFVRTTNLADKFARPEIRTFVRLKIAEALLSSEAAEREKTLREQYQNEEHGH